MRVGEWRAGEAVGRQAGRHTHSTTLYSLRRLHNALYCVPGRRSPPCQHFPLAILTTAPPTYGSLVRTLSTHLSARGQSLTASGPGLSWPLTPSHLPRAHLTSLPKLLPSQPPTPTPPGRYYQSMLGHTVKWGSSVGHLRWGLGSQAVGRLLDLRRGTREAISGWSSFKTVKRWLGFTSLSHRGGGFLEGRKERGVEEGRRGEGGGGQG